jgi:hypothetical protein
MDVASRIQALEERGRQRDRDYARLFAWTSQAVTDLAALSATVDSLSARVATLEARLHPPGPSSLDSLIIPDLPELFAEFRGQRFTLLWRGSRDGFGANEFHRLCDGHANTVTLIHDTEGNIFGGYTPVMWDSSTGKKADPSMKSFLFTLKNPYHLPERRFNLKVDKKHRAIGCFAGRGPCFRDIGVSSHCNANNNSFTFHFGSSYTNDSGIDARMFFTGSDKFTVTEIEVFEIGN